MSDLIDLSSVDKILAIRYDPSRMQDLALDTLDKAKNGEINIPDANNPFFYALEWSALLAAATMQNHTDLITGFYPKMANSDDDLYRWMSDEDYAGRFSEPSRMSITLILNADEVRARAIQVAADSNDDIDSVYSKLSIPRNSSYSIAGADFSQEYPIEIRVMKHGGFMVVWDVSEPSPLMTLETNQLDWRMIKVDNMNLLYITVPLRH